MQRWLTTTKLFAAFAVWSCCALTFAQTPARKVDGIAPANPLRSDLPATPIARSEKSVTKTPANNVPANTIQPVQHTESLPAPLRLAPEEPELSPQPGGQFSPQGDNSVLAPGPNQYLEADPHLAWPAGAPARQLYGDGNFGYGNHASPPRDPWFAHNRPNDPGRHAGWGDPLTGTSWLNRPWYFGLFAGGMLTDDLVLGHVNTDSAPILGMRLGHDFDHYWGWEVRYAFSRVETFTGAGVPIVEPGREYFVDVALLHYPWGDSRWRPYLLTGVGFLNARYVNDLGQAIDDTALTIPLGIGLKLYNSPWFTIRFDAVDNLSFSGSHLDHMHNFSLMVGAEFRFGGTRPSYFPWTGNTSYW
jgi:hypothetical protein